jgi:RNA polymerase sigma-70 factor (ECF subfamily)
LGKFGRFSAPGGAGRKRLICRHVTENRETNLAAAARNGDAESFSRLCERHYPALVAIAYAQLADRGLAEDAAQEALLIAYRDIAKLKNAARFLPWLVAICRNTAIDMAKARARERQAGIEDGGPVSAASRHERDAVAVVRGIILRLRPALRDVILLRYYSEMCYEQMAALLGVSEEAVNGQLRRARKIIRRQWQRHAAMEIEP